MYRNLLILELQTNRAARSFPNRDIWVGATRRGFQSLEDNDTFVSAALSAGRKPITVIPCKTVEDQPFGEAIH